MVWRRLVGRLADDVVSGERDEQERAGDGIGIYSEYLAESDDEDDRALQALWKSLEEARARRASQDLSVRQVMAALLCLLCVSSRRPSRRLHW